jgi:hypothetical protein
MFSPSRDQARQFFFDTRRKYRPGEPLHGLEQTALEVVLLHPQFHSMLDRSERNLDRDWLPESGQMNPFLHLTLHFAVQEQLSTGQPTGIFEGSDRLRARPPSGHDALHAVAECLVRTVSQTERTAAPLDPTLYLEGIRRRLEEN